MDKAVKALHLRGVEFRDWRIKRNSLGMEFSWIAGGVFLMGDPESDVPQRAVTIGTGFWLGRHQVTQGQYESVMGVNPSHFQDGGPDCPVENVSWNDAKDFISRLNQKSTKFIYSLPTEAEWEYAARAGTTTATAFGDDLSSADANFNGNKPYGNAPMGPFLQKPVKVGSYRPNAWGLYDMHGNVWEWVEDWYVTPQSKLRLKVLRGGSWHDDGKLVPSAFRGQGYPSTRRNVYGFRLVARMRP